jgi:hypothetical protein
VQTLNYFLLTYLIPIPGLIPGSRDWRLPIPKSRDWQMVPGLQALSRKVACRQNALDTLTTTDTGSRTARLDDDVPKFSDLHEYHCPNWWRSRRSLNTAKVAQMATHREGQMFSRKQIQKSPNRRLSRPVGNPGCEGNVGQA